MWLQLQEEWNHIRENLPLCLKNPIPFIVGHTNNTSHFLQSKLGVIDSEDPRLKSVLFLKPCVSSQSNEKAVYFAQWERQKTTLPVRFCVPHCAHFFS